MLMVNPVAAAPHSVCGFSQIGEIPMSRLNWRELVSAEADIWDCRR